MTERTDMFSEGIATAPSMGIWLAETVERLGIDKVASELNLPPETVRRAMELQSPYGSLRRILRDYRASLEGGSRLAVGRDGVEIMTLYADGGRNFGDGAYDEQDWRGVRMQDCNFARSRFRKTNLTDAWLLGCDFTVASFELARLDGANLSLGALVGATLSGASMRETGLAAADLTHAMLDGADLRGACLAGAKLRGAKLNDANFEGANLLYADLTEAYIDGAIFKGACLAGAKLPPCLRQEMKENETDAE